MVRRRSRSTRLILSAFVLAIGAGLIYRRTHPEGFSFRRSSSTGGLVLEVRSLPISNHLDFGSFSVAAKATHDSIITVDESQMHNARLTGHFSADGPGVRVLLLDDDQYRMFEQKATPGQVLYMSKEAKAGDLEAVIPHAGKYHLVFDNSQSDSSVNVKADVTVHYELVRVDSDAARKK